MSAPEPPCRTKGERHTMIYMHRIKGFMCQGCDFNMDLDDQWWRDGEPKPPPYKAQEQPQQGQGALL